MTIEMAERLLKIVSEYLKEQPRWFSTKERDPRKAIPSKHLLELITKKHGDPEMELPLPLAALRAGMDPFNPCFVVWTSPDWNGGEAPIPPDPQEPGTHSPRG